MGKVRISASIPSDVLDKFDEICRRTGQPNRSNAIATAMHDYIINNRWVDKEGEVNGVVLMTYNHDVRGINAALTSVQHSYGHVINASLHIHMDSHQCLEIIAVKGDMKEISELVKGLQGKKGVLSIKLVTAA